ncbi:MAG TPA: hypothetical protein VFZ53_02560 [Polyangiaceae bacterium]
MTAQARQEPAASGRGPARKVLSALAVGALLIADPAHADLGTDVERVALAWSAFGRVHRLPPRLLERGEALPLLFPPELVGTDASGCLTVAVLGTTSMQFLVDPGGRSAVRNALDMPEGSLAGALELTRCGPRKSELADVLLEMRSPRGVLEALAVASQRRPPALTAVLPHRDPGPMAPPGGSGPRPTVAPLAVRVQAVEQRAARSGALELTNEDFTASALGTGVELVPLGAGCHRFELLAGERTQSDRRSVDLDLEISSVDGSRLLATDKSESNDARALVCVGDPTPVAMRFSGAPPGSHVTLLRARWDLAPGLPLRWPAEARAPMSAVLREQSLGLAGAKLVDEALGVQGSTAMPVEVEPGACYLAVVIELRGTAQTLALAAQNGPHQAESRAPLDAPGTALSFCAGASPRALLEVEARGVSLVWMTALWQVGRIRLGEGEH